MVIKKEPRKKSGFLVHPFETGDKKYHASYGNHNKTVKSFKTLKRAKAYLRKNKIEEAEYDHPSGPKLVNLNKKKKVNRRIKRKINSCNKFGIQRLKYL